MLLNARADSSTAAQFPTAVQAHAEMLMSESEAAYEGLERPLTLDEARTVIRLAEAEGYLP